MSVESVQNTENRRASENRDQYEKDLIARHRKELTDLQKRHQRDVERIKAEYDNAMTNLRHGNTQDLTEREKKHLKDVQEMQDANRKYITRIRSDDEEKLEATKENLGGEVDRAKYKDKYDQDRLTKEFDGELTKRSEQSQAMANHYAESEHEALEDQSKRIMTKDEKDKEFLRAQLQKSRVDHNREVTELSRNRDETVNGLKSQMKSQREMLSDKYHDDLAREQERYTEHLDNMQSGFQDSLKQTKTKFRDKTEELSDQYVDHFDKLRETTNDRVEKQINAVKRENQYLEDQVVLTKEKDTVQGRIQNQHLQDQYERRFDELQKRNEVSNEMAHKEKTRDIEKLQNQHAREMQNTHADFGRKLEEQKFGADKDFDQQVGEAYRERDMTKLQAENSKKKIFENYADLTENQAEFYGDQLDSKQRAHEKMLFEQRATLDKQKMQTVNGMQNQLAKENMIHQEKLMETISNYEKQLATTKNDYEKKLRHQADLFHDQTEKQVKAMELDRETSESKLQARISGMKEYYDKELDQLRKRQLSERQEAAMKRNS